MLKSQCLLLLCLFALTNICLAQSEPPATGHPPAHQHPREAIPEQYATPSLDLALMKDAVDGYNLQLITRNYRFRPPGLEPEGSPDHTLAGHAHLFINGQKISRVYAKYVHIPSKLLTQPVNQLTVFLNSDTHGSWTRDQKQVLATLFIKPSSEQAVVHRFTTSNIY